MAARWDKEYKFDAQEFASFEPIALHPGDSITTTCTWFYPAQADAPQVMGWGNSSRDEMCFSILMRYPRLIGTDGSPSCTDEELEGVE